MRKKKNDYTFIIFFDNRVEKMTYVHNCYNSVKWLENSYKYRDYKYINVYLRRTGEFLFRHYKASFINPFP